MNNNRRPVICSWKYGSCKFPVPKMLHFRFPLSNASVIPTKCLVSLLSYRKSIVPCTLYQRSSKASIHWIRTIDLYFPMRIQHQCIPTRGENRVVYTLCNMLSGCLYILSYLIIANACSSSLIIIGAGQLFGSSWWVHKYMCFVSLHGVVIVASLVPLPGATIPHRNNLITGSLIQP